MCTKKVSGSTYGQSCSCTGDCSSTCTSAGYTGYSTCNCVYFDPTYTWQSAGSSSSHCSNTSYPMCNASNAGASRCDDNYTTTYSFSTTNEYNLTTCTTGTSFACNSSNVNNSYISSCAETQSPLTCCNACTVPGNAGSGGSNSTDASITNVTSSSGLRTGNGQITIIYNG